MRMKSLLAGLAALVMTATSAEAITFSLPAGDTTTMYGGTFDGNVEGTPIPGLTGALAFQLVSQSTNFWEIEFWLENTSTVDSTITVLAFDTNPDIIGAATTDDWDVFVFGGALPNGFGAVEMCVKEAGNTNNCQAGQLGLDDGAGAAHFTITFELGSVVSTFEMSNFGVRYQSITGLGESCGVEDCTSGTGTLVPEPATWIMMIVGFAGMGYALKYRRRREYGELIAV